MTTKRKGKAVQPVTGEVLNSDNPKDRARMAVDSRVNAINVMSAFSLYGDGLDATAAMVELTKTGDAVVKGNTHDLERMLMAQAHALEAIFTREALMAHGAQYLPQYEARLKLALRAQNQCRMTLETLATIKNPPVVFAKQANIANNQQVNNGDAVSVARAGETAIQQPKLLEAPHAKPEWMDAGTARAAKDADSVVATVEAIDRTAHTRRQGKVKP